MLHRMQTTDYRLQCECGTEVDVDDVFGACESLLSPDEVGECLDVWVDTGIMEFLWVGDEPDSLSVQIRKALLEGTGVGAG